MRKNMFRTYEKGGKEKEEGEEDDDDDEETMEWPDSPRWSVVKTFTFVMIIKIQGEPKMVV